MSPSVLSGTYPNAEECLVLARSIANDTLRSTAGQILTDTAPFTLPFLNMAIQTVSKSLANNGLSTTIIDNVILSSLTPVTDVAPDVQVYVSPNGYFNGTTMSPTPRLPSNMIVPLRVWERVTGSGQLFVPVRPAHDGLPSRNQGTYMFQYEWRGDYLWFVGATSPIDIRLRFKGSLPIIANDANLEETFIQIRGGSRAIAYEVVAAYAEARQSALTPGQSQAARARAEFHTNELINEFVKMQQREGFRPRGFRDGENSIDGALGGDYR